MSKRDDLMKGLGNVRESMGDFDGGSGYGWMAKAETTLARPGSADNRLSSQPTMAPSWRTSSRSPSASTGMDGCAARAPAAAARTSAA